jgi:hypothetical protein
MKESEIENYFIGRVRELGGVAEKVIARGTRGYFDVIALLPHGRVIFAEIKRPKGGVVSKHQMLRHQVYRSLGGEVALIKSFADTDRLLPLPQGGG